MQSRPNPPGVSADAVVDFDHHSDEFNLNLQAANADLRQKCPVAWNTKYDGFWYLSSYDAVSQTARDDATFSHKYDPDAENGVNYQGEMGVPRPEGQPALGIGEIDGDYHLALRHALAPFFSPGAVDKMKPLMEEKAHEFLDQHIENGAMDLVLDYASPVPAILTMKLMGLPLDNWHIYASMFHNVMAVPQDSPEYAEAIAKVPAMMEEVLQHAAARRADKKEDLTSFLIQFEFEGEKLDDTQLLNILWNLIAGGVDTTTSQTALTLRHLGTHQDLRQQLINHPELYRTATDEFLRYFTVNRSLSRTVTKDVELNGQHLKKNDRLIISWLSANHDEKEFERPDEVILDRTPNRHLAFGLGPHRCIGSHLARLMSEVLVKAVLDRIPDYQVEENDTYQYMSNPSMTGLSKLPVTFTPKAKRD
ncbi:cytochrome P450 [Mycobacterium montefiorense]|uniref:Cytochrome P450 n=1 Tax=Mycobacterium montefiorense TaxID=154654 RepID=A0AA37UM55_9MYCO|nr:cytochrome P450 [Mycobacterium montefiorense]GBG37341.1 cytochrome P450 [Mycobacterium montefiorense]GKU37946.1 cytochrome P450 [Mycobacterium montefiorense]GKU42103.1 cytochrome P450 [Mycobacterium montefiorense]GKU45971.1 cytochrome P450 [Mycobacterium montefiorense]GKU52838.1 cytochrome P450 [Mycobacterium montefiorense]